MEDDEIISILSGVVYLDAPAVRYLTERGFGELIGFAAGDSIAADAREKYSEDPLNDGITGGIRNCRQAFNAGDSFELLPLSGSCRVLTSLVDYHDNIIAAYASGLYDNKLGGRVYASGYYPFSWISDYRKTIELKRISAYLSGGRLPSYVENYCRIRNITLTGNGKTCVTLFNTSNDSIIDLTVLVRGEKMQGRLCTIYGGNKTISAAGTENICGKVYSKYCIGELKPYEGTVLVI